MDSMILKLVQSRKKSIQVLEVEVTKLEKLASEARNPSAQAALESVAVVKRQRLVKLRTSWPACWRPRRRRRCCRWIPSSGAASEDSTSPSELRGQLWNKPVRVGLRVLTMWRGLRFR